MTSEYRRAKGGEVGVPRTVFWRSIALKAAQSFVISGGCGAKNKGPGLGQATPAGLRRDYRTTIRSASNHDISHNVCDEPPPPPTHLELQRCLEPHPEPRRHLLHGHRTLRGRLGNFAP